MEVIDNTALKVSLPHYLADDVCSRIEKSTVCKQDERSKEVLVYWGQYETIQLAQIFDHARPSLNLPEVPAPILQNYNWPGVHKPFQHQKDTAAYLSIRQRAFCFNEAGTGKTSAAIWAADYLMNIGAVQRVLVICPLSIMQTAWQADVFKTAMHRTCGIAHGSAERRKKIIQSDFDFVVINYDGTHIVKDELMSAGFDLIIVDEANAYKSVSTRRWKTLAQLVRPHTWLWMMTGTPASQSPVDAFGLARLVSPERVPKFSTAWRDRVMAQTSRFRWIPRATAKDEVFRALQPAIRFTKKECLDLPALTYQTRKVPLTPQAQKYYDTLKVQMRIEAAGEQVSAVNAAASMTKLLQISGGAVYSDGKQVLEFDVNPRLNELKDVLDETSNKVVVFVPFIHTIDVIVKFLNRFDITNEVIKGDVSVPRRKEIFDKFQTQVDPRVLIVQPQSAAHGVTLTAADTIVFWGPVMSVETYIQCIGRIDRVGQKNKMTVVHLEGSEMERKLYRLLQGKVDSHLTIVDLYKQELEGSSQED